MYIKMGVRGSTLHGHVSMMEKEHIKSLKILFPHVNYKEVSVFTKLPPLDALGLPLTEWFVFSLNK